MTDPNKLEALKQQMEASDKQTREEGFRLFMQDPMVKALISMIPPVPNSPEIVQTVIKAAFDAGFRVGNGAMLIDIMKAMAKGRPT